MMHGMGQQHMMGPMIQGQCLSPLSASVFETKQLMRNALHNI